MEICPERGTYRARFYSSIIYHILKVSLGLFSCIIIGGGRVVAKYVFHVPAGDNESGQTANKTVDWGKISYSFGKGLQEELVTCFGLKTCIFPDEDGIELDEGCAGMGKDWFNFRFRMFANTAIYLDMINIPFEWRGKGIGEWLINKLKTFARDNRLSYIFLGSYEPSNPFWESCGFVKITEYPDFVLGTDSMAK
ncbi:MAG: hypothetical protein CVU89_08125 [Firmicutes bacterium HGW-Firmicutes-14]|nr:MAG: hypothetical protein CVU89_08125 [Firmicutes bacterium HGW-Firmicutes-14]